MNPGFWKGRRVFLTGHTGFKGAWLSLWLQRLGAEVFGYALDPPTEPSLFRLAHVAEGLHDHRGDVLDAAALSTSLRNFHPEIVFHLAAQALVRKSYLDPVGTFATNVMGTVHLLEGIRNLPSVRSVVVVTSDKCYENREWPRGYREDDALGGFDPYSSSKGCAELVAAAYRRSYFQDGPAYVATARAGNVIGGGDWAQERLLPDLVRAFQRGVPAVIRNPLATRPWQHVLEPLSGYLRLAEALCEDGPSAVGAWNFGPQESSVVPVSRIVESAVLLWGGDAKWRLEQGARPHEALSLNLDIRKAGEHLHWHPLLPIETTLEWTLLWYRALAEGKSAIDLASHDICEYEAGLLSRPAER